MANHRCPTSYQAKRYLRELPPLANTYLAQQLVALGISHWLGCLRRDVLKAQC
jgi:hypothetical protein